MSPTRHGRVAAACDDARVRRLALLIVLTIACRAWVIAFDAAPVRRPLVVERFLTRDEPRLEEYEGRRLMLARNARFKKEAWLEAVVRFDRTNGLAYDIVASGGSGVVIRRALIPSLEGEVDLWRRGEADRYGLTADNYEFAGTPPGDDAAWSETLVAITPRRTHHLLLNGQVALSDEGDLLRVQGRLAKSPSFWVSRVDVVRRYGRLHGVRVPVELETVAHVRFAGRSEMRIAYTYDSVNGHRVPSP
jgi:hypothetical protein